MVNFEHNEVIKVGICTFRRASLFDTLHSIAEQDIDAGQKISVIVADNDTQADLAEKIAAFSKKTKLRISYIHAPACNISIARNAILDAVKGGLLVFIDDDEVAPPNWVSSMLSAQKETKASIVFGPALAVYPQKAPKWMSVNDFHSNIPTLKNGRVETGYCSNVLLDMDHPIVSQTRFDPIFGRTGGEDTDFFFRLYSQNVPMVIDMEANVFEPVTEGRLSFQWVIKRRFITGQIYGYCKMNSGVRVSLWKRFAFSLSAALKTIACIFTGVLLFWRPISAIYWLMRGIFHLGAIAGGIKPPQLLIYGAEPA